jgi:hypothetical protein
MERIAVASFRFALSKSCTLVVVGTSSRGPPSIDSKTDPQRGSVILLGCPKTPRIRFARPWKLQGKIRVENSDTSGFSLS